jgi:hypothetical protein
VLERVYTLTALKQEKVDRDNDYDDDDDNVPRSVQQQVYICVYTVFYGSNTSYSLLTSHKPVYYYSCFYYYYLFFQQSSLHARIIFRPNRYIIGHRDNMPYSSLLCTSAQRVREIAISIETVKSKVLLFTDGKRTQYVLYTLHITLMNQS